MHYAILIYSEFFFDIVYLILLNTNPSVISFVVVPASLSPASGRFKVIVALYFILFICKTNFLGERCMRNIYDYTLEELEQVRAEKAAKRGGFEKRILLKEVVEE